MEKLKKRAVKAEPVQRAVKSSKKSTAKRRNPNAVTDMQSKNSDSKARKLANLKPFAPGQSGNPAGRPKSVLYLSEAYRKQLALVCPEDSEGRTFAEVIAERVCRVAAQGDFKAAKEIADRTEGRAKQTVDITMTKTEEDRYEAMVLGLMQKARDNGMPISRVEAIHYLSAFDEKILALASVENGGGK